MTDWKMLFKFIILPTIIGIVVLLIMGIIYMVTKLFLVAMAGETVIPVY